MKSASKLQHKPSYHLQYGRHGLLSGKMEAGATSLILASPGAASDAFGWKGEYLNCVEHDVQVLCCFLQDVGVPAAWNLEVSVCFCLPSFRLGCPSQLRSASRLWGPTFSTLDLHFRDCFFQSVCVNTALLTLSWQRNAKIRCCCGIGLCKQSAVMDT